jgi:hypothetical protein
MRRSAQHRSRSTDRPRLIENALTTHTCPDRTEKFTEPCEWAMEVGVTCSEHPRARSSLG